MNEFTPRIRTRVKIRKAQVETDVKSWDERKNCNRNPSGWVSIKQCKLLNIQRRSLQCSSAMSVSEAPDEAVSYAMLISTSVCVDSH